MDDRASAVRRGGQATHAEIDRKVVEGQAAFGTDSASGHVGRALVGAAGKVDHVQASVGNVLQQGWYAAGSLGASAASGLEQVARDD